MVSTQGSDECCDRVLSILHKVEMAGKWSTNASTTLFFLTPKKYCLRAADDR